MIIFTDASFSSESKVAGFGFCIIDKKFEYKAGNYSQGHRDNNVAELSAVAEALRYSKKLNLFKLTDDRTLTVITDSKYAVNKILDNNINFIDDNEKQIVQEIKGLLKESKLKWQLIQIKGHMKGTDKFSYYNEICDRISGDYRYLGEIEKQKQLNYMIKKSKGKKK